MILCMCSSGGFQLSSLRLSPSYWRSRSLVIIFTVVVSGLFARLGAVATFVIPNDFRRLTLANLLLRARVFYRRERVFV